MCHPLLGRVGLCWCRGIGPADGCFHENVQRQRSGHHVTGVHGAGLAGGPGQQPAEEIPGMTHARPPPRWHWRCQACWLNLGLLVLVLASFVSLDLQWGKFLSTDALASMARFVGELLVPQTTPVFLQKVLWASLETLAMSVLGTALAAV